MASWLLNLQHAPMAGFHVFFPNQLNKKLCNSTLWFFLCRPAELVYAWWSHSKRCVTIRAAVHKGCSWGRDLWGRRSGVGHLRGPFPLLCHACHSPRSLPPPRTRLSRQAPRLRLVISSWNRREALAPQPWQKNRACSKGRFRAGFTQCARHATSVSHFFKRENCSTS